MSAYRRIWCDDCKQWEVHQAVEIPSERPPVSRDLVFWMLMSAVGGTVLIFLWLMWMLSGATGGMG